MAQLADGSRAWLDSRGLLHLRSGSADCYEASFVLCDGPIGGWLANGETFGADYWVEQPPTVDPRWVQEHVLQPFIRSLA